MEQRNERFLRLKEVLTTYPISRSSWLSGVKSGRFPKPYKLGAKIVAWRLADIEALVAGIIGGGAK